MKLEFIDRVKEGQRLGKNVIDGSGNILLRAGIELSQVYISKLKALGVFYLYVDDERLEDVAVNDAKFEEMKQRTRKNLNDVVKSINNGNIMKAKEAIKCVENLVEYILDMEVVNTSLFDIKVHDEYTYVHSIDTGILSSFLGVTMKFNREQLKDLAVGSTLHDIGKINTPLAILKKKGKLTEEEYEKIKLHPVQGAEILKKYYHSSSPAIKSILEHHEKVDGTGYPFGLTGDKISKYGKVVAICDAYNAVSTNRSYREKLSPNEAYEFILGGSGSYFDEEIVKEFKRTFAVYPLGSCVRLSNGVEGYVIRQNENFPDRPIIRVLYDSETKIAIKFFEINLLKTPNLIITKMV